jgi:hypothetical protein
MLRKLMIEMTTCIANATMTTTAATMTAAAATTKTTRPTTTTTTTTTDDVDAVTSNRGALMVSGRQAFNLRFDSIRFICLQAVCCNSTQQRRPRDLATATTVRGG